MASCRASPKIDYGYVIHCMWPLSMNPFLPAFNSFSAHNIQFQTKSSAMANNKRASSATTRKWTDPAIVSLLSWLNHSIQHKEIEFDETIIDYLKDSCGIQFTPSQIKSKLYNLWDKKGQNDSKSVDDLRSQGHSSLPGLALPLRSQIEAQTEFLEANTRKIQSTRQTRSSKKFWAPSVSREVSETGGQRTPRKRKYETSDISVSCPPTGEGSWPNTKNEAEEEKAKEQKGIESATDSHRQAADSILTPQPKQESHARSTSIIIDSEEESSDKQDEISSLPKFCKTPASQVITESRTATPGGRETSITPTEIKDTIEHDAELGSLKSFRNLSQDASQERTSDKAESSLKRDIHRTEQYPGELSAEPQTLNIDLRLDLAKEKIAHLQAKLSKTKQEKQEFEAKFNAKVAELGLFNSIRGQLDKSDPSYLIEKRDKKISELLTELNDRQKLVEFTKFRTSVRSRVKPYICESFMQVFAECKQVMCANDSEKLPFAPALEQSEELQFLVLRSMGLDTGFVSPEALLGLGSKLSLLGPNAVVRSLASSCLQLWVFQTEFPDFGKGSSKILETYRKLVLKQGVSTTKFLI